METLVDTFNQFFEKVGAYIVRHLDGEPQIFLYSRRYDPDAPLQLTSGGIRSEETPEQALWRELKEETGFDPLPVIRKVGVSETPLLVRSIKRHWYLLDGSSLPESWTHTVTGDGADQGERYHYAWYPVNDALELAGDLGKLLNPDSVPELYPQPENVA
jgi:8-oxo-dGTP pyrophosphatase MutT (NUDIX family)